MAVGDNTAASVIWVPGEANGYNAELQPVTAPNTVSGFLGEDAITLAAAEAYTDVLRASLVASGVLPV